MQIRLLDAHKAGPKSKDNVIGFGQVEIDPAGQNITVEVSRSWKDKSDKYQEEVVFSGSTVSPFRFPCRLFKGKEGNGNFLQADVALDLETRAAIEAKLLAHFGLAK